MTRTGSPAARDGRRDRRQRDFQRGIGPVLDRERPAPGLMGRTRDQQVMLAGAEPDRLLQAAFRQGLAVEHHVDRGARLAEVHRDPAVAVFLDDGVSEQEQHQQYGAAARGIKEPSWARDGRFRSRSRPPGRRARGLAGTGGGGIAIRTEGFSGRHGRPRSRFGGRLHSRDRPGRLDNRTQVLCQRRCQLSHRPVPVASLLRHRLEADRFEVRVEVGTKLRRGRRRLGQDLAQDGPHRAFKRQAPRQELVKDDTQRVDVDAGPTSPGWPRICSGDM